MRKIYVEVTCRVIINAEEGVPVEDILSDMDYEFKSNTEGADIVDTEITNWKIQDSK